MDKEKDQQKNEHDAANNNAADDLLVIAENIKQSHFQQGDEKSHTTAESKLHANRASAMIVAIVSIIFFGLLIVSCFINIDEIASTRGELVSIAGVEFVQHLEGGIIDKYFVARGDIIQKGDLIATLKDPSSVSQNIISRKRLTIDYLTKERLNALLTNREPNFEHLTNDKELIDAQERLYLQVVTDQKQEMAYYDESIENKYGVLKSMRMRLASAKKQLSLLKEQVKMRENSYKSQGSSKLEVTAAKIKLLSMLREIESLAENILVTQNSMAEITIEKEKAQSQRQVEYHTEYEKAQASIAELVEKRKADQDKESRLTVRSPIYGEIRDLPVYSSAVLESGGVIAEIVPLKEGLKAEVHIKPKDIGFVSIGQKVTLKFDTYDYSQFGSIKGVVSRISTGTFKDEQTNEVYYLGVVTLKEKFITSRGNKYILVPGMEMTADIKIGERRAISYILKPVVYGLERAFREK